MIRKLSLIFAAILIAAGYCFAEKEPELTPELEKNNKTYIQNVTQQIEDLEKVVADDFADDFVNYCIILIALGGIMYVGMKIIKCLQKGSPVDLNTLILPFFFVFVICSYRPFTSFVRHTASGFEYLIASKCKDIDTELNQLRDEKVRLIRKVNDKIYEVQMEQADGWVEELWVIIKSCWRDLKAWINMDKIVGYIFLLMMFISAFLVRIVGGILYIVLYIIGPISIAVSAIPPFKDSWKTWLSTFIWAQLFSPISQIVSYILANLEKSSLLIDIARLEQIYDNYAGNLSEPLEENFYSGITYIAFMAAGIVMYWCVPTISSWIVPAQGNSTLSYLNTFMTKTLAGSIQGGNMIKRKLFFRKH